MQKKLIIIVFVFFSLFLASSAYPAQNLMAYEKAACVRISKGEIDEAQEILQKILEVAPNNLNAKLYLGITLHMKEDPETAVKMFNEIDRELNKMVGSGRSFGDEAMFATMAQDRRGEIFFSNDKKGLLNYCHGMALKERKEFKMAEKKFKSAIKDDYDESAARLHLVDTYIKMKNFKSASSQLAKLEKKSDNTDLLLFLRGYIAYRNGKTQDALNAFEKTAPTIPEAEKNLALLHYNMGDYQKSFEYWQRIVSENADDKEVLINIGRTSFHMGDSAKAQEYLTKAGIDTPPEKFSPKKLPLVYDAQIKRIPIELKCK
jgi:tetratricopeptide (TPR) repeat protein